MLRTLGAVGGIARGIFLLLMAAAWGGGALVVHANGAPQSAVASLAALALVAGLGGVAVIVRAFYKLQQRVDPTEAAEWRSREDDLAHDDSKDRAEALIAKYLRERSPAGGTGPADQAHRGGAAPAFGRAVR